MAHLVVMTKIHMWPYVVAIRYKSVRSQVRQVLPVAIICQLENSTSTAACSISKSNLFPLPIGQPLSDPNPQFFGEFLAELESYIDSAYKHVINEW